MTDPTETSAGETDWFRDLAIRQVKELLAKCDELAKERDVATERAMEAENEVERLREIERVLGLEIGILRGSGDRVRKEREQLLATTERQRDELAELRERIGKHKPGPALHAWRRSDDQPGVVHGDEDWVRERVARYGGTHVAIETCSYQGGWQEVGR